jgi:hypothetical protein
MRPASLMKVDELDHAELWRLLRYFTATGIFRWNIRAAQHVKAGDVAGSPNGRGYTQIKLRGRSYPAHRLAFLYMTGAWPEADVDHINGVRSDNRWENLRPATNAENAQNAKRRKDNTSGLAGVTRRGRRWRAQINAGGVRHNLGHHDTAEQAYAAHAEAKARLHPFNPTLRGGTH